MDCGRIFPVAVCLAGLLAFSAKAEDALPKIRQFDISTVETLGLQMYEQDQEAWKATDVLTSEYTPDQLKADGIRGWIVDTRGMTAIVHFIREDSNGPEILCNVNFGQDIAPSCVQPKDRALDAAELAQYNARQLALKNFKSSCSDTYNTIVLKDPKSSDWLVWVMAASKTHDAIILGGHSRFTVSGDGKLVRQKDDLSQTCRNFTRQKGPHGEEADIIITQVVSDIPVETLVFASLSYKITIRVGTPDGKAWKIADGHISSIDMDMPGIDGFAARTLASFDEDCLVGIRKKDDQGGKVFNLPVKSVIAATEIGDSYKPDIPSDDIASLVVCRRDSFTLAPNDYKVLFGGLPFMVIAPGADKRKLSGTLFMTKGQFQFQTDGLKPSDKQLLDINTRLNAFQDKPWPKKTSP